MCSFLFTASGGKKCSDAPKHDEKRYSSKSVLAEGRPLLFTLDGQSCFCLNGTIETFAGPFIDSRKKLTHFSYTLPTWPSECGGEGTGENKHHNSQINVNSSNHLSLGCCLSASLLPRNIQRLQGRTYWGSAHTLLQFSPGKMTIQPCQMWIRSERDEHNAGKRNSGYHDDSDKPWDTPCSFCSTWADNGDGCRPSEHKMYWTVSSLLLQVTQSWRSTAATLRENDCSAILNV